MKLKPKVLFVIDTLAIGGAEKSLLDVVNGFSHIKPVVCVLYKTDNSLEKKFQEKGIDLICLNLKKKDKLWFLNGKKHFEKILHKEKPDIIQSYLFRSDIISRISKKSDNMLLGGSFVSDAYSKFRYKQLSLSMKFKLKIVEWIDRFTIQNNDFVLSITKTIAKNNSRTLRYPLTKCHVIYRGRTINPIERKKIYAIKNKQVFNILTVGRLLQSKGYIDIINAASLLKNQNISFQWKIAGEGSDRKIIEKHIADTNTQNVISLLGTRNDIEKLLQESHLFVFASHYEGLGGALIEAMLSKIPIIVSDIPVFREIISNDAAYFFEMGNAQDLADKIKNISENYDEALKKGEQAHKEAVSKYNIDSIAHQTENLYFDLIKKKAKSK